MIIILGDVHIPKYIQRTPTTEAFKEFLKWLNSSFDFSKITLIFAGDILDSPTDLNFSFIKQFMEVISKFKQVYMVKGNHDENSKGTSLIIFHKIPNVQVIEELTILKVEENTFCFYPFLDREKYLSFIPSEKIDYTVGHYSFEGMNFGQPDEITIPYRPEKLEIIGHIHNSLVNLSNKQVCLGSVFPNRYGEHTTKKLYIEIENGNYTIKTLPDFLIYRDIDFSELDSIVEEKIPTVYNVSEVPSILEAKEKLSKLNIFYRIVSVKKKELKSEDLDLLKEGIEENNFDLLKNFENFLEKNKEKLSKFLPILDEVREEIVNLSKS